MRESAKALKTGGSTTQPRLLCWPQRDYFVFEITCQWEKTYSRELLGRSADLLHSDHHLTLLLFFSPISSLGIGLAINLVCLLLSLLPNFILGFPSGEKHNIFTCCVHRHECSCRSHDNYEHVSVGQQQVPGLLLISLHDSQISLISLVPAVSTQVGYNYHIWLGSD